MPVNASYEFANAEKKFLAAQTDQEKLEGLEEMIRTVPKHKGSENILANLRTRYKKLEEKIKKAKSQKKKGAVVFSIKKAEMQAVLVGLTSSGKSSILKLLTNTNPQIGNYGFVTKTPEVGIFEYEHCPIQIIDLPAIGAESFETGIVNTSDTAILVIQSLQEIPEIEKQLIKCKAKRIVVYNKIDLLDENQKRKLKETLKTKKYNFVMLSTKTQEGLEELKEKIFKSFDKIRVYTKSPNEKFPDNEPMILPPETLVESIAKTIFKGNLKIIKKIRIWGPSSKFGGQEIGLKHSLKDKDILEFSTK